MKTPKPIPIQKIIAKCENLLHSGQTFKLVSDEGTLCVEFPHSGCILDIGDTVVHHRREDAEQEALKNDNTIILLVTHNDQDWTIASEFFDSNDNVSVNKLGYVVLTLKEGEKW